MCYHTYELMINEKLLKPYSPRETEGPIYKAWEQSGLFRPETSIEAGYTGAQSSTFTMVLPPPNVTGVLHLGHAYESSLQDAIIRYERMQGKRTLWIPGSDSAAIATQARVEKDIQKEEGKNRHDIGREELVRRVKEFAKRSENTILTQIRKMGASLDWSRYAYTLDEKRERAVATAFKRMYDAHLIYRGSRIVNWDPKGQTTISDDEIVYVEEKGKLYFLKYGPFIISTARPETKFGDKYVVMHPDDTRYKKYHHGEKLTVDWIGGPIEATVIKDPSIDMEFGTGVMTITPWHSIADFELAERYDLEKEQIIDTYGKLLPIAGEFAGMKIKDAREKIIKKLGDRGLVEKVEDYTHNIATAERTGGIIEPQIMEQWFVDVDKPFPMKHSAIPGIRPDDMVSLKDLMNKAVTGGGVEIVQENFRKSYLHWVENLHDWCISRQIWFGHRIPVWYKGNEIFCDVEAPKEDGWTQEPDVLDTWFSSALWTFSTLGWPDQTEDLKMYHPTALMSPAYEILFLWVSRMILMSGFHLGEVPFKTVLIHGLVRDSKGQKFSKSLANGIDPLNMIEKYGSDALRMGLLAGSAIGSDIRFDEQKIKGYKHFANKLWNIARFVLSNTEDLDYAVKPPFAPNDFETLTQLDAVVLDVSKDMEEYRYHLAAEKIYHYIWHTFADDIIERSKEALFKGTPEAKLSAQWMLYHILSTMLKLLHPFMPFVTEEIWSMMPHEKSRPFLMVETWPK